ncbi:MAG: EpsI family protein [Methylococcaceae bacterium]|nr:EpsI family protein [Methylococcaceae bacterium]
MAFNELVAIPSEWSGNAKQLNPEIIFNKSIFLLLLLLSSSAIASHFIQDREDIIPARKAFLNFPLQLGKWQGRNDYLSQFYLNELKLTDYAIINYAQLESGSSINFYSAYYQAQRRGVAVHSPKGCIPGDGWQITQFGQLKFPDITVEGNVLELNRAVIQKGDSRQLVYYWFQQRGRTITNEYLVKWYLFYDALTMNRTDGALVRLVTSVGNGEDIDVADQRLQSFMKDLIPELPAYLPGKSVAN